MPKQAITPPDVSVAAPGYSAAVLASGTRTLFISGQGPRDYDATPETQVRETFEQIGSLLHAAGGSFDDITMIRAYLVHLQRDLPAFRKVRLEFLEDPYPAATVVGVTELAVEGLEIEIEAVAVL